VTTNRARRGNGSWLAEAGGSPPRPRLEEHLFRPPPAEEGGPAAGLAAELRRQAAELIRVDADLARQAARVAALERAPRRRYDPGRHLLFAPVATGYSMVEAIGPPPAAGSRVAFANEGERRFVVLRVGPSPLPVDGRACAFLEPWPVEGARP